MTANVYQLANDTSSDPSKTQDIVLSVLVACVLLFYIISICVVGCTRHNLRIQVSLQPEQKKKPKSGGREKGNDIDIVTIVSSKSGGTIEMKPNTNEPVNAGAL